MTLQGIGTKVRTLVGAVVVAAALAAVAAAPAFAAPPDKSKIRNGCAITTPSGGLDIYADGMTITIISDMGDGRKETKKYKCVDGTWVPQARVSPAVGSHVYRGPVVLNR
jgi:hypothetical protein